MEDSIDIVNLDAVPLQIENELFTGLPLVSEELDTRKLSPMRIRELVGEYSTVGIQITQEPNIGSGETTLTENGDIKVIIPIIRPFGMDMVVIDELIHVEQIIRGLRSGLTPKEIIDNPAQNKVVAEIGALEAQIKYWKQLPFSLKKQPAYLQAKKDAEDRLRGFKTKLPEGLNPNKDDLINPYKRVIELR